MRTLLADYDPRRKVKCRSSDLRCRRVAPGVYRFRGKEVSIASACGLAVEVSRPWSGELVPSYSFSCARHHDCVGFCEECRLVAVDRDLRRWQAWAYLDSYRDVVEVTVVELSPVRKTRGERAAGKYMAYRDQQTNKKLADGPGFVLKVFLAGD